MIAQTQIPPVKPGLRRRASLGALLLFLWSIFAHPLFAQEGAVSEEQLKAAFLYNFARFVDWPPTAFENESTPITVGVLSNEAFANTLTTLVREKKAHGRPLVIKKLAGVHEAGSCQIVFVAREEARRTSQVLDVVRKKPILTIGETEEILDGGIIYLLRDDKQLRFDINVGAAEESKLTISSRLLSLARKTKKTEASK